MSNHLRDKSAKLLWNANHDRITCEPIRGLIGTEDLELAYAIQEVNINKRLSRDIRIVGRKVGLTSFAVQKQLGVDQPDFGTLLSDMEVLNGQAVDCVLLMQPKVEAEVAFVLSKSLVGQSIGITDVIRSIDYAVASIEIVGSRISNWDIKITDTIADNASASHFVLGHRPRRLENVDLINCSMELSKNGEVVSTGKGADCYGSPLNAVLWLARTMYKMGTPLKKGDIVLSGALGPMVNVVPGDHVEASIESLGHVSVSFN